MGNKIGMYNIDWKIHILIYKLKVKIKCKRKILFLESTIENIEQLTPIDRKIQLNNFVRYLQEVNESGYE